jgi:cyclic pyranopterin phosphate synthase
MQNKLSHIDKKGKANMVDIGAKADQERTAIAEGLIKLQPETLKILKKNQMKKGDVLTVAEIAGIQSAKHTAELIPLCHNIALNKVSVKATPIKNGVHVVSEAKCTGKTGVEMEALTATSVALLTIYDMCKAVDKTMIIDNIHLIKKTKV